ncbi:MAG: ATP-binding protein [Candidatus Methanomethylophilaceae archaeon]|nr:ATP-binding protein [Candidatus Methanomethylophilaceae archaeon]
MTGCRQIGKTYSIREFVTKEYRSHIYINFEVQPDKKNLFKGDRSPDELVSRLILSEGVRMYPGKSAIVLDEIQACADAYSALKPLSEDNRFDVICSGSFSGINLDDGDHLSPLGYASIMQMHPMDFEEYLWAMGINKDLISDIRTGIQNLERIDDYFHHAFMKHFRTYMVVGGMPAAVKIYSETKDYVRTHDALRNIVDILKKDTGKYSRKAGRVKINRCLDSIPQQLSKENKKFIYSDVEKRKGVGKKTYGSALDWLKEAGLISLCHNLTEPNKPLSGKIMEDAFKVFMNDTGLLMALVDSYDPADIVLKDPYSNNGAVIECAVASALVKKGYPLYYYSKPDSTLEIDFVTEFEGTPILMEVKSGRNKRAKSLSTLMKEKDRKRKGYKVMDSNIETDDLGIVHLPLYAPCFFKDVTTPGIPEPPSTDDLNEMYLRRKTG